MAVEITDVAASVEGLREVELDVVIGADTQATWELLEASIREALSEPYEATVLLATDDPFPDLGALLQTRVTVRLRRGESSRAFHGIVRRGEEVDHHLDGRPIVRLSLVPELWLLARRRDSRIFAHKTTPQVVRDVLDAAGLYPGDRLQLRLGTSPPTLHAIREYCVQYDETDLDFIRRLLEEEGTTFYFVHDGDRGETLVLADGERAALEGTYGVLDNGGNAEVGLVPTDRARLEPRQTIQRFQAHAEVQSTSMAQRQLDFTNYRQRQLWTGERAERADRALPVYEHPARMIFTGDGADVDGSGPSLADSILGNLRGASGGRMGDAMGISLGETVRAAIPTAARPPLPRHTGNTATLLAGIRLEESGSRASVFAGEGLVIGFSAGFVFDLVDHPRNDLEQPYLLTWVEHSVVAGTWSDDHRPRYANRFGCTPRSAFFRPLRLTPRPRVHGTQTATVVGGPGEEMHVDPYGRVRVQFHWDRQHHYDDNLPTTLGLAAPGTIGLGTVVAVESIVAQVTSTAAAEPRTVCWVRCAQAWAGPHWGSMFIPRVGMEVVVTFLEGDPDRPLVVGSVYNSANPPPYPLPAQYHRSTIMSRSIPTPATGGRVGFNELRFDDLAGSEQIYLHAEKDLTEVVRNHHETFVGGSHDVEVRGDQTNLVGRNQQESITGNQTLTVAAQQGTSVQLHRDVRVGGVEQRIAANGRVTMAGAFDGQVVQGTHLHYVAPAASQQIASRPEVAALIRQATRSAAVLTRAASSSNGDGEGASGEGGGESGHEADSTGNGDGAGGGGAASGGEGEVLEQYIVEGDRFKRIDGSETVEIGDRDTSVGGDDGLSVTGAFSLHAGTATVSTVTGEVKSLALTGPTGGDLVRLSRGSSEELVMNGTQIEMSHSHGTAKLLLSADGCELTTESGRIWLTRGDSGTDGNIRVTADGTALMASKGLAAIVSVDKDGGCDITADTEITLKVGSTSLKLTTSGVEILGSTVTVNGVRISQ